MGEGFNHRHMQEWQEENECVKSVQKNGWKTKRQKTVKQLCQILNSEKQKYAETKNTTQTAAASAGNVTVILRPTTNNKLLTKTKYSKVKSPQCLTLIKLS